MLVTIWLGVEIMKIGFILCLSQFTSLYNQKKKKSYHPPFPILLLLCPLNKEFSIYLSVWIDIPPPIKKAQSQPH